MNHQNQNQSKNKTKIGAVCGRFQIFHHDHLKYVLAAKEQCDFLLVGITSPDPLLSPNETADANRCLPEANPCTFYERLSIMKECLLQAGLSLSEFDIIPFPIGRPDLIPYYVPLDATCFFTIYDAWGEEKVLRLKNLGYQTHVLWRSEEKLLSSSQIRKKIQLGEPWEAFVPAAAYQYILSHGIDQRIRNFAVDSSAKK